MINHINTCSDICRCADIYQGSELFYTNNVHCKGVIITFGVNTITCCSVGIKNSSRIYVGQNGTIVVYKGHDNSVTFNLDSSNDYNINIALSLEHEAIHVVISTVVKETELIKESVL